MSFKMVLSPYFLVTSSASITTLPGSFESGKEIFITELSSSSTSMRSTLSNFFISDCAIDALEALARNFSINRSVSSIFLAWFF